MTLKFLVKSTEINEKKANHTHPLREEKLQIRHIKESIVR